MAEPDKEARNSALVEVHDLLGLKGPLTEATKCIRDAIASWAGPWLRRRDANAAANTFRNLAAVLREQGLEIKAGELELTQRASVRAAYEQVVEQTRIEAVMRAAIEHGATLSLPAASSSSGRKQIDPDWMTRLFDRAKRVSNEDMLRVWGRMLAEEACAPGSFSYRSVDIVASMTNDEASRFQKFCECAYVTEEYQPQTGVLVVARDKARRFLNYDDLSLLASIGLVFMQDTWLGNLHLPLVGGVAHIRVAGVRLAITPEPTYSYGTGDDGQPKIVYLGKIQFTEMGTSLRRLIPVPRNEEFVRLVIEAADNMPDRLRCKTVMLPD